MKFTEQLRRIADPIWEASFDHPFIKGIADGSLPIKCFRYYILQDSYYLSHFAKVQAYGAAKAEDFKTAARLAAHAQATDQAELRLHENFARRLGITEEEKAKFFPSPTAYAYTSHLYRVALTGRIGEIISALLPCYWLYREIGERLKDARPSEPIYQEWIAAYGSQWFHDLVKEQIDRLDEIAKQVPEADRERMKQHFIISSQYELAFWEMAYTLEKWKAEPGIE